MDAGSASISGQEVPTERSEVHSSSPCTKYSPARSSLSVNVCFSLCQTVWSDTSGSTRGKWNHILRSTIFYSFPEFPSLVKSTEEKWGFSNCKGKNFGPTSVRGQTGTPPEVVPNIPIEPNRTGPFHLTSDRNFRKFWHNGRHPISTYD